jgi:hypothetical protein
MDAKANLEICLAYELDADDLLALEVKASLRALPRQSPRYLLFRQDDKLPLGHWWQDDSEMAERAPDILAGERAAFLVFASRLAGRLMRDPLLELTSVRLEWTGLVGPGGASAREASLAVRMPGVAAEPALYEYLVEPWTLDLRHGLLASEPLPFEPVSRLRRRKQARAMALVEPDGLAHLADFEARLWRSAFA